jgi:glycosyltransferase involved in cell wall biosynthesis
MNLPFISFIIPFYNRYALLKEALLSVLSSSFKDVEIILIDDASNSEGLNNMLDFIKPFSNISYFRQAKNLGPGAARNRGLSIAKGEWVFFMDSDDVILGDVLPDLAAFLSKERDCDMVVFEKYVSRLSDGRTQIKQFGDGTADGVITALENEGCPLWNFCFRRIFLNNTGIRCPETYAFEDWTTVISAWFYSEKCLLFPGCFYEYREESEGSLVLLDRKFNFESKNIPSGLNEFFNRLIQLSTIDMPLYKKKNLDRLIYRHILHSQWEPDLYKNNKIVENMLDRLRGKIADYSENFAIKIFISPCFLGAINLAALIKEWGGHIAGFIDNNPASPRSLSLKKATALNVYKIDEIIGGGGGIVIFGKYAGVIADQYADMGLVEGRDYIRI